MLEWKLNQRGKLVMYFWVRKEEKLRCQDSKLNFYVKELLSYKNKQNKNRFMKTIIGIFTARKTNN